jgi:regulator of sigma E protease
MADSPAAASGVRVGEQITAVDGSKLYSLQTLIEYLEEKKDTPVTLSVTDGSISRSVTLAAELVPRTKPLGRLEVTDEKRFASLTVQPFSAEEEGAHPITASSKSRLEIHDITDETGFVFVNLALRDRITAVNGHSVDSLESWISEINRPSDRALSLTVSHDDSEYAAPVMGSAEAELVPPSETAMLGFEFASRQMVIHLNPIDQFSEIVRTTFQVLGSVASPKSDIGIRNLSGPPGIIRVIHQFSQIDIRLVIWFICLLNINLAILNLLPIPVLDGGHIVFAAIARLRRKALPPNLVVGTQGVFMVLLFSLMIYVSIFDVRRWQGDNEAELKDELQRSLIVDPVFDSSRNSG